MDRIEEIDESPEVFENDIALYLRQFCEEQKIEDMSKESQGRWNAALLYIRRHVFPDKSILKLSKALDGYINNSYGSNDINIFNTDNLNRSNCNAYDINKINAICDIYIYLCYMYDKEISKMGFSKLTGINPDTIHDWGNKINKLSTSGCDIYQKLTAEREESLVAKLVVNKNPVGIIAILNKHFGYNMPGVRTQEAKKQVLTAEDLPRLDTELHDNQAQFGNSDDES